MNTLWNPGRLLLADENATYWFPPSASTFADEVDSTYNLILWIDVVFFVAIVWALVYFSVKYRQAKGGKATSRATHNNLLEISWSVFPSILLVLMFVKGTWAFLDMKSAPADANVVEVSAKKWSWLFSYSGGVNHPELHLLKGQPTKVIIRSQDVLHSFYIPAFRAKQDAVPGRYTEIWFEPTVANEKVSDEELKAAMDKFKAENRPFDPKEAGFNQWGYKFFDLYCTEYCGQDHSLMQTLVVVHETQADLDQFMVEAGKRPEGMSREEYGQTIYQQRGCVSCHSIDGSARTGPTFKGSFGTERKLASGGTVKMDENYILESILNPQAKVVAGFQPVMPTFKGQLTDEQLDGLVAYIRSLKN